MHAYHAPGSRTAARGLFTCLALALAVSLPARAETRRLLVLRVDFQPDSLESTTGDGSFGSAFLFERPAVLDPLPHDSLYVDSHLRFLEHWYQRASSGELELDWEIWPRGGQAAYRLDFPMWHYHWNQSSLRTDEQLAELFREALEKADADPQLLLFDSNGQRRFDTVMVMHAGVGQDFGEDATPHDIPSAWLGPSLDGGPAAHQTTLHDVRAPGDTLRWTVEQGLLVPESENHAAFSQGVAGLLVLQFGHELGLPNLYESNTGRSVIGKWGLMDQGSANYLGLLPAPLDAWSRLWLGWGQAQTQVQPQDSLLVAAPDGPAELPRILRIPLTEDEEYLVEYRRRSEAGRDWTWARDREGRWARLQQDYTISFQDTLGVPGDSTGALVEAGNLDFDLPGSGLLIWHVDHRAATAQAVAGNTVNDDRLRRGVDLEEGDGVQDLGRDYGLFSPRSSVGLGGPEDPWQQPSTGWIFANPHYAYSDVSLAWDTEPSTATNDGLFTGLRLGGFSGPQGAGSQRRYPDHGRFDLSWDFRPALHGEALAPVLETEARNGARVQVFSWAHEADSSGTLLLSLVDGSGRSYGRSLRGDLDLWPRADGFSSPLPPEWQHGLRAIQGLSIDNACALLACRGDSLALFTPQDAGPGSRLALSSARHFPRGLRGFLVPDGHPRSAGAPLYIVEGDSLRRLDPATLGDLASAATAVVEGGLQLLDVRDASGWPAILGHSALGASWLRWGDGTTQAVAEGSQLLALEEDFAVTIPELAQDSLMATALLFNSQDVAFYRSSRLIRRLELAPQVVRPTQFGPDPGLEIVVQEAGGACRVFNQAGVEVADLELEAGHGPLVTGSRTEQQGLALLAAAPDRLSALDATGTSPPTWPRTWRPLVDGPVALPSLGLVLGLAEDGTVLAWEAALDGPVWTQPRGSANGGMRAAHGGTLHEQPLQAVREHGAFVWPNPSSDEAHFHYVLEAPARVKVSIFNTAGHLVRRLEAQHPTAGEQEQVWHLGQVAPGAYFAVLEASGGANWTRRVKVAVLK